MLIQNKKQGLSLGLKNESKKHYRYDENNKDYLENAK